MLNVVYPLSPTMRLVTLDPYWCALERTVRGRWQPVEVIDVATAEAFAGRLFDHHGPPVSIPLPIER